MALPQRPTLITLRESLEPYITTLLNTAARTRDAQAAKQVAELIPAVDAILASVELLLTAKAELERRHFASMLAATTQPTVRTFSGEPMLGAAVTRRAPASRSTGGRTRRTNNGAGKQRATGRRGRRVPVPV